MPTARRPRTGPRLEDGWIRAGYSGPDARVVELGVSTNRTTQPATWVAAFLDLSPSGQRVAQVRPARLAPEQNVLWMRAGGAVTHLGPIDYGT